jgi:two-component system sensor histidine kinase KdpD
MDDPERRRTVMRALASARRLQSLTRDVLDSASLEAGELTYQIEPVDLVEEAEAAVTAARDLYPDQAVDLRRPPAGVWVEADGERIQQVLANLIDNAVKHSPAGLPVTVSVGADGTGPQVSVTDRGPGIAAADAQRVFDKFVRGRRESTRGTGLGLYICRRIVEAHGGRIRADAADDGGGATFSFTLPPAREPETVD